jgi:hypothetical protein
LGDIDGDGDIDILAVSNTGPGTPVPVRIHLNDGAGLFSNAPDVLIPYGVGSLALGDMDNDGDLDIVNFANYSPGIVTVLLNAGGGTFAGSYSSSAGYGGTSFTTRSLGDVDGDGDLGLMLSDYSSSSVLFLFNTGNGSFSGGSNLQLGGGYSGVVSGGLTSVALGDVDGDGDLDLAGTNTYFQSTGPPPGKVSIQLNNGRGTFGNGMDMAVAYNPYNVVMSDVDGDGDLDIVAACASINPGRASVLLNQPGLVTAASAVTAATTFALYPNPAHGAVTLTGAVPNAPLTVLDALGRVLLTTNADASGTARLVLPQGLPAGMYLVRSGGQVRRLVVD